MAEGLYLRLLIVSLLVLFPTPMLEADWDECHDDLDRLRRAASDAADEAERLHSAQEEMESKGEEARSKADEVGSARAMLRLCSRECSFERLTYQSALSDYESARSDFESATDEYESTKGSLESELDTVASRVRAASSSCEYPLGGSYVVGPPRASSGDRLRRLLQSHKGRLAPQLLMETCRKSRSEEDCKKCLE